MIKQLIAYSLQLLEANLDACAKPTRSSTRYKLQAISSRSGFTLIETLVSITILVMAVAGPMSLAAQSLATAFYARDQITAFHLAQEAIEVIRAQRDANALQIITSGATVDLLAGIPNTTGQPFTVDTITRAMTECTGTCAPLRNNGELYGYGVGGTWADTRFTRTVRATIVDVAGDEVRISVEVRWQTGVYAERSFTISENVYRWISAS
jgi:prepilin-type N-terminal cleavage/methylation domain-containing protein